MRKLLIILAVIVGLIVVVAVVGYILPEVHTATAQRSFTSPAQDAWRLIIEVHEYPEWRPNVEGVNVVSSEPLVWEEAWGRGDNITFRETEREEGRKFVAAIANDDLPFGGSWTYLVEPSEEGCTVSITENGEIHDPFFRFVSHLFLDQTSTMRAYLDRMEAALANGGGSE